MLSDLEGMRGRQAGPTVVAGARRQRCRLGQSWDKGERRRPISMAVGALVESEADGGCGGVQAREKATGG